MLANPESNKIPKVVAQTYFNLLKKVHLIIIYMPTYGIRFDYLKVAHSERNEVGYLWNILNFAQIVPISGLYTERFYFLSSG